MPDKIAPYSFHTLPIELVYRIFDNLDFTRILLSLRNVCVRFNQITDTYHRYQVSSSLTISIEYNKFCLDNDYIGY